MSTIYISLDLAQISLLKLMYVSSLQIGGALLAPDNAPENFTELQKLLKFTPEFTIATECVLQKAAWYTALLRDCVCSLKALLLEDSLWEVFVDIEMKLLPIIAGMYIPTVCSRCRIDAKFYFANGL